MALRRSKSETPLAEPATVETVPAKSAGKGRPTPTRKEAEAAARARARPPRSRRERARAQRARRQQSTQKVRQGMKEGDERYLMGRDKGPVRRFVRDYVDARFSIMEMMIPLLVIALVLSVSGSQQLAAASSTLMLTTLVVVIFDGFLVRRKVRKEVTRRFPDASHKGLTYYAVTRSSQMRFMRLPKAQVKVGETLPEQYR